MRRNPADAASVAGSEAAVRHRLGILAPWVFLPFVLLIVHSCDSIRDSAPPDDAGKRFVSLVPSLSELIVALGAGGSLAARTDYDTHPDLLSLPSVGGGLDPSLESLVGLGIDVVLMPGGRDAGALGRRLEGLGIEVHIIPTNTVPELYGAIARLGGIFEVTSAADSLSERMERKIAEIAERVEGRTPVPVMYVVASDPPITTGKGTFIDDLIRIAGGRNVFFDSELSWPSVGFESVVNRDPELLIWPRGEYSTESAEGLKVTPGWQDVPAVRDGRVLFVDGDLFSRPGPGFPTAVRTLAEALHPDAFGSSPHLP
jgi:iron complex transport system substrate-binding protein